MSVLLNVIIHGMMPGWSQIPRFPKVFGGIQTVLMLDFGSCVNMKRRLKNSEETIHNMTGKKTIAH